MAKVKINRDLALGPQVSPAGSEVEVSNSLAKELEKMGYLEKESKPAAKRKTKEQKSTKKTK